MRVEVEQARRVWLNKIVSYDAQVGVGVQYGMVASISNHGLVMVVALPDYDECFPVLMIALGVVEQTLTLVEQ